MSFKPHPQRWFQDILDAIGMIEEFTAGMNFEAFRSNTMAIAAVERKLLVIAKPPSDWGTKQKGVIPTNRGAIRGIGNQLRHAYDRIDLETIWAAVSNDLPPLKAALIIR